MPPRRDRRVVSCGRGRRGGGSCDGGCSSGGGISSSRSSSDSDDLDVQAGEVEPGRTGVRGRGGGVPLAQQLFSATTVERVARHLLRASRLPYCQGGDFKADLCWLCDNEDGRELVVCSHDDCPAAMHASCLEREAGVIVPSGDAPWSCPRCRLCR
jgi:hypothetical protein